MDPDIRYSVNHLLEFSTRIFLHCGVPPEDAKQAAEVLVTADSWGIETHGVARLRNYYEMLVRGFANPRPHIQVIRQLPACAALDGDNGLGLVVGPTANKIAMEKAELGGFLQTLQCNQKQLTRFLVWSVFTIKGVLIAKSASSHVS